ncbi:MAG: hypothetical protein IJ719_22110 [Clostridia bacterium]|nr:hypothetical protein [Clostridia bacterium]
MNKLFTVLLAVFMAFFSTALSETVSYIDNGLWITVPDGWQDSGGWWTNDTEMVNFSTMDIYTILPTGSDIKDYDKQDIIDQLFLGMDIDAKSYQKIKTQRDWGAGAAKVEMETYPYSMEIGMILVDTALCTIMYAETAQSSLSDEGITKAFKWISNEAPEGFEQDDSRKNTITAEGYYLYKIPAVVNLSENDFNIVYLDMPSDTLSVTRSGYSYSQINSLLKFGESTEMIIWKIGEDGLNGEGATVKIRIKQNKYPDMDFRDPDIASIFMASLANQLSVDGHYEMETYNGIPYGSFQSIVSQHEIRYATIINGSIIYVFESSEQEFTASDKDMLYKVLNSISLVE